MTKKIHCIVVDDEPLARELLTLYLSAFTHWEVVAQCRSVAEAYEALSQNTIDVIFLDINLPDKNGVEFLAGLKVPPHVVFTTAYAEYAARAFDLQAVDYLVKPITEERFKEAIIKLERQQQNLTLPPAKTQIDYVFLKQEGRLVKVLFEDILYVEAVKDFSKLYLKEKVMLISTHLKLMEGLLPASRFLRLHRSYIVALDKITALQGNVVEIGRKELPVGTTYKEELVKRLHLNG